MTTQNALNFDLKMVKELIYDKCGFGLTNLKVNSESVEYGACSFNLDEKKMVHRVSKITPTKVGQFVTIWKRNENGITEPFDSSDDFDFIAITSKSAGNIGQFIFPKSVLVDKGIITQNGKGGKRGIRVYPPWDTVTNKQAEKTQSWQINYFVAIKNDNTMDFDLIRKMLIETLQTG
ncbi:MepB family protein [Fluviicola sp.]|uniref:MepB family protein n=1 Tax=Fluviicola sp. TaxID=1917219 RepID=UPI003D2C04D7